MSGIFRRVSRQIKIPLFLEEQKTTVVIALFWGLWGYAFVFVVGSLSPD
jgi:hypothetical protein